MPFWLKVLAESVEAYLTEGDHKLEAAEAAKWEILELYEKDIGKYAKGYAAKVRAIFRTIERYFDFSRSGWAKVTGIGKQAFKGCDSGLR